MKKTMRNIALAALFLTGTIVAGCQKNEIITDNGNASADVTDLKSNVVTLTTTVSLPATKALTEGGIKTFYVGDQIAVIYNTSATTKAKAVSNKLTLGNLHNGGRSATFTVTFTGEIDKTQGVEYVYPASMANDDCTINWDALSTQNGSLDYIAENLDLCQGTGSWDGENLPSNVAMQNKIAIGKFTIYEKKSSTESWDYTDEVTKMVVKNGSRTYTISNRTSTEGPIFIAFEPEVSSDFDFDIYLNVYNRYTKTVSGKTLSRNKIYPINLTLPANFTVDLTEAPAGDFKITDGAILTGTLNNKTKIIVEQDGATVTLRDVNITSLGSGCDWAGINCLNNTTLVLEGENTVMSGTTSYNGRHRYPGIFIAPDKTLTIQGSGKLTALGNQSDPNDYGGAGIGGGDGISCGNIIIDGGKIVARGGWGAAGIGAGAPDDAVSCGNITISGGYPVEAYGGEFAAGIGSGYAKEASSVCGNILISWKEGPGTKIVAYGGEFAAGIGTGSVDSNYDTVQSRCGSITITGGYVNVQGGKDSPYDVGRGGDFGGDGYAVVGTISITAASPTGHVLNGDDGPARIDPNN